MTMTEDTTIVTDTLPLSDIPPAESDDGKEPCPECGERYVPGPGLARHLRAAHGLDYVPNADRVKCTLCDKELSPSSIRKHMRVVHNQYQRASRRGRPLGSKNRVLEVAKPLPKPRITRSVLTADEITRAAALSLWPNSIPHDKVGVLLEWHRHTAEFLESVINGG